MKPKVKITENKESYVLQLERRDGTIINILVPKEDNEVYEQIKDGTYGLNLVFEGHYW